MKALQEAEKMEPYVGISLLQVFFPGDNLLPEEEAWRKRTIKDLKPADKENPGMVIPNEARNSGDIGVQGAASTN